MTYRTNAELKRIAQHALKAEYGFAPAQNKITLLEADRNGTYIRFSVGVETYSFESRIDHVGGMESIWCGKGTIEHITDRESALNRWM